MSDLNLPGAEDEGIMGDEPQGDGARRLAEDAGGDVSDLRNDDEAAGLGRTPMPPD